MEGPREPHPRQDAQNAAPLPLPRAFRKPKLVREACFRRKVVIDAPEPLPLHLQALPEYSRPRGGNGEAIQAQCEVTTRHQRFSDEGRAEEKALMTLGLRIGDFVTAVGRVDTTERPPAEVEALILEQVERPLVLHVYRWGTHPFVRVPATPGYSGIPGLSSDVDAIVCSFLPVPDFVRTSALCRFWHRRAQVETTLVWVARSGRTIQHHLQMVLAPFGIDVSVLLDLDSLYVEDINMHISNMRGEVPYKEALRNEAEILREVYAVYQREPRAFKRAFEEAREEAWFCRCGAEDAHADDQDFECNDCDRIFNSRKAAMTIAGVEPRPGECAIQ